MSDLFEQRFFSAPDGARIGYQVAGPEDAPKILLCNGLGGNHHAYGPLARDLVPYYRLIVWDYRGLFTSAPEERGTIPATLAPDKLRVESHARDGLALLDHEGLDRFPIIAWSMGVQVALEIYRLIGRRITGLALINGIDGRVYDTIFGKIPGTGHVLPPILRLLRCAWPVSQTVVGQTTRHPEFIALAARLGIVHRDIDREAAFKVVKAFGTLDMKLYYSQLQVLGDHDASDIPGKIRCPTLLITSDRDIFTPGFAGRRMADRISDLRQISFPGGSHYSPLEYVDEINHAVVTFLEDRVAGDGTASPGADG